MSRGKKEFSVTMASTTSTVLPSYAELIKRNKLLLPDLRKRALYPWFREPIRLSEASTFLNVRLTPHMLSTGERYSYLPHIVQPHRVGVQVCSICRQPLRRLSMLEWQCMNPFCKDVVRDRHSSTFTHARGPVRGIVKVNYQKNFITQVDPIVENGSPVMMQDGKQAATVWINKVILMLDRRYPAITLSQVYRTCGMLCDQKGWRMY